MANSVKCCYEMQLKSISLCILLLLNYCSNQFYVSAKSLEQTRQSCEHVENYFSSINITTDRDGTG